jgi:uncharacterized membrane protein
MESTLIEVNNATIMQEAKADLTGKWGVGVAAYIVYAVILVLASLIPGATFLLAGPFAVGMAILGLKFARREHAEVSNIFDGFKQFGDALAAGILIALGVFIGFLLLIVPGVILAIGWSMTYCILAEQPELGAVKAMKKSWAMMDGYKTDYFIMLLKFMLLGIACIFTLGIGFFFLGPYIQTCVARYYLAIRRVNGELDDEKDITKHLVV